VIGEHSRIIIVKSH